MIRLWSGRAAGCYAVLFGLAALAGCGGAREGTVTGTVKYHGKPLPGGRLTFRPADPGANSVPVLIDENGKYEATLPVGAVQVAVDNREWEPQSREAGAGPVLPAEVMKKIGGGKAPKADQAAATPAANAPEKPAGKYVAIPRKYYDADQSGLQFKVESGSQVHDIELK